MEKVIYEDISPCSHISKGLFIQNLFFLRKLKCTKFPVSGRFRRRVCAYVCECVCVKESVCDLCWRVCACAS